MYLMGRSRESELRQFCKAIKYGKHGAAYLRKLGLAEARARLDVDDDIV